MKYRNRLRWLLRSRLPAALSAWIGQWYEPEARNILGDARLIKLSLLIIVIVTSTLSAPAAARDPLGIVDYKPSTFAEQPTGPFFFSIGDKLRFSRTITEEATVLFDGSLTAVYPSPDQAKAAIISNGKLYLAELGQPAKLLLTAVDNFAARIRHLGDIFYEYPTLQWDASSHHLYIIRARKEDRPTQMFPRDSTLVRIDVTEPTRITDIVTDFRSLHYFLVGNDAICVDYDMRNGDVIWKCSRNGIATVAKEIADDRILLKNGELIQGKPFLSYHPDIYESEIWLTLYGFSFRFTQDKKFGFFSKDRPQSPILLLKTGYNIKGMFVDGVSQYGCAVLPGGRYALLNIAGGSSAAQVLVDGLTGQYKSLPRDTRVYRNLNTSDYGNVKIGFRGTDSNEFVPIGHLRPVLSPRSP